MNRFRCLLLLAATTLAASPLSAHGGQYRGPSDVYPSQPGGGSGNAGSSPGGNKSGGASSAGPTSPGSGPNSTPPTAGAPASRRARGVALDDDLGRWEFWWEFGKDPFLRLRDAIYAPSRTPEDDLLLGGLGRAKAAIERPRAADLDAVADALRRSLRDTRNRDLVSGCAIALAKIGRETPDWQLLDQFTPMLRLGDQELRETGALAIGIAGVGGAASVGVLAGLVRDDSAGRRASGDTAVNERTRAFAAFGLGLLLARAKDADDAVGIATPLLEVIEQPGRFGRDLEVAAIEGLSLLPRTLQQPAAKLLRERTVAALGAFYVADRGPGARLLQAHVPPALAHLLTPGDALAKYWLGVFAADLRAGIDTAAGKLQGRGGNLFVAQSCAAALGHLGAPWQDDTGEGAELGQLLVSTYEHHRDQQTRAFALVSLARLGGARARETLLRELRRSGKATEQPWCAMALGVLDARRASQRAAAGRAPESDPEIARALLDAFDAARNPSSIGALAVALGLGGDAAAGDRLRVALVDHRHRDDVVGYVALGLGLLRDPRAAPDIRSLLQGASRRPFVLMQSVRALGLLGDHTAADLLCAELGQPDASLVRLSAAASALGQIGDRRSLQPLLRMLADAELTPLTRAFAAVALGGVCDKDPLPWNSAFATYTNYRAATETLTDGASGILDIL